jgi:hypothetical protein
LPVERADSVGIVQNTTGDELRWFNPRDVRHQYPRREKQCTRIGGSGQAHMDRDGQCVYGQSRNPYFDWNGA